MSAAALVPGRRAADPDGRVVMHGLDWWKYEAMLAIRGDAAGAPASSRQTTRPKLSASSARRFAASAMPGWAASPGERSIRESTRRSFGPLAPVRRGEGEG
jgi:hypothetical protein